MTENPTNFQTSKPVIQRPDIKEIEKITAKLNPNERELILSVCKAQEVTFSQYLGPIPPPEMLQSYAAINSTFPERIIKMAEEQQQHRMFLEKQVIPKRESLNSRGQIFAFIIGIFGLSCGTYCIIKGQPVAGVTIGGTIIVSLVTAFLYGKKKQEKELSEKRPQQ